MKFLVVLLSLSFCMSPLYSASEQDKLREEIARLQDQSEVLAARINQLDKKVARGSIKRKPSKNEVGNTEENYHSSVLSVHALDGHPDSLEFYPTALVADNHVVTYIAGTPVVASPYLGSRPAFDGSDYIVNVSSINRDVRLMQQRRRLYRAYEKVGYPVPNMPIIALSGKVMPTGTIGSTYFNHTTSDWDLGTSELDVAAALNSKVEAYLSVAYDSAPPASGGQRVSNSALNLRMGFINIGNLDKSPYYFSAGQFFAPFGSFSSAMISPPLPLIMSRTLSRPIVLGYKSQYETGPFAAVYGFKGDTTLDGSGVGGANLGYVYNTGVASGQLGVSFISSINNSSGMQFTGSRPGSTFAGFSSPTNGSELVKKIPGADVYGNIRFDRYNLTAEWSGATTHFRSEDLSFNGVGAKPQSGILEAGATFEAFAHPASLGIGYQWSRQALALNIPRQRYNCVFSTSIWKDTVESIEYRHDIDYRRNQFANGAAPTGISNLNTVATGRSADMLLASIGLFF